MQNNNEKELSSNILIGLDKKKKDIFSNWNYFNYWKKYLYSTLKLLFSLLNQNVIIFFSLFLSSLKQLLENSLSNLSSFSLQTTTGMQHHSPPHHPTCISPPFRERPALTSPSISRRVLPTASSWKIWATLTSSAWSSSVRSFWDAPRVQKSHFFVFVFLSFFILKSNLYPTKCGGLTVFGVPHLTHTRSISQRFYATAHTRTPGTAICLADYSTCFVWLRVRAIIYLR